MAYSKSFTSMVASLAILVCLTAASPCTDVCGGQCGLAKGACDLVGLLGPLCQTQFNMCQMTCSAVCNCVDTCGQTCGDKLTECRGDGSNPLAFITCGLEFASCNAVCHTQCGFTTIAGVINTATGGGAAPEP